VAGDERSRLHQIVDELAEEELPIARQLLELLAKGLAAPRVPTSPAVTADDVCDDEDDAEDAVGDAQTSAETLAKLAQLTDVELLRLDDLLESDREAAKQFWRERFGEELSDDELVEDSPR
jgi:hypothetical protein